MDLLGAYDSNSDSDSYDDQVVKQPVSAAAATKSSTTEPSARTKNPVSSTTASAKAKKRGTKMLKLSAVLPEHIWNQLTGTAGGGGDGFDGDSSGTEDDSDAEQANASKKKTKGGTSSAKPLEFSSSTNASATAKDSGLQSLLQELPKSKAAPLNSTSNMLGNEDNTKQESSSLGFAFITSTVETTKRKRSGGDEVRDIHEVAAKPPSKPSTKVEPPPPKPPVPRPSASRTAPRPAAPMPRPMKRQAAPTTSYNYQAAQNASSASGAAPAPGRGGNKKLSRKKQMEAMLRAGKFDQVEGDHVLEASANVYQPSEMDSGPSYNSHGVRVVPMSSYNPSTGTTSASTDITGQQKNKHQLNSLLASAASLEAQRSQNPHFSGRAAGTGSGQRATAKRKYGW
ncbi:MAG: hypothetical protein SGILL_005547 [Bacillariaceae sp.]